MSTASSEPANDIDHSISSSFDETVTLDDPKAPFPGWQPSPRQIAAWGAIIREANEAARRDEHQERWGYD